MTDSSNWKTIKRICAYCQKEYLPTTSWQRTCSNYCGYTFRNNKKKRNNINTGDCLRCGTSLVNRRIDAIYCSKTCKCLDHNFKHRGSKVVKRMTTSRRMQIINRDNAVCYICKKTIPIDRIEIDHLLPVSRLGSSDASNLSVSCLPCNRSRGNKLGIEQLVRLFELRPPLDH